MKKIFFIIICSISFNVCYGQTKKISVDEQKIKKTILEFLNWYKQDQIVDTTKKIDSTKIYHPIIVRKRLDTMTKVTIDMVAVEEYLGYIKSSTCVSESFINDLRQYHQKIANDIELLKPYPTKEGDFAIPGLNLDVIFGFEPEEILDHIKEGKFTKIYTIYDKAIVKFDISRFDQYIFTLTKVDNKWLIDYYGLDRTNLDKMEK